MTLTCENTAREYLRVSYDRSGEERSPDEQHAEHAEVAEQRGWTLHPDPYRDLGSASHLARKIRDDYQRMLKDLRAGRFGAQTLVLWEGSRGSRQVREWLDLLDLLRDNGIGVYVHTRRRVFDPANEYDWADLISDAVKHQLASVDTSKRAQRNARARAVEGKPAGRINYGYTREYSTEVVSGRVVRTSKQVPDPVWAPLIQELLGGWDAAGAEVPGRIERGHSFRAISRDWEERGIRQHNGNPFSAAGLRVLADYKAYVGIRVHDAGRRGRKPSANAVEYPGAWPAIVPEARFLAVQRILADPTRRKSRPGRGVHLLSMLALCDVCGGPMAAMWRRESGKRGRQAREEQLYRCHKRNCVSANYVELNAYAENVLLGYLERADVYAHLVQADESTAAALAAAEAEVERIRRDMNEVERLQRAGEYPPASAGRMLVVYQADLDAAELRATQLRTPSRLAGLIQPGPDVARRWADAPMSTKRETVRMLFSREVLGELRVQRAPRTGSIRTPMEQRVRLGRDSDTGGGLGATA